jgi:sulfite exporter TauE/SafE
MNNEIFVLSITAASLGFFHTLIGPDHYLPFIVMSKARGWPLSKTAWITVACGVGHVLSSILLGFIGVAFGVALVRLELIEGVRGNIAAWALIGFGLAYCIWGIRQAVRNRPHRHKHVHNGDDRHQHVHTHIGKHSHVHDKKGTLTPWVLFTIFVLGPCEPLIPILMYPAAKESVLGIVIVASVFGTVTISTMLVIVMLTAKGMQFLPMGKLERYSHALAGGAICLSGLAIQLLGL